VPVEGNLDPSRWIALWSRLGAQGSAGSVFAHLAKAYAEPSRAYHNSEHIRDCLIQLDLNRGLARKPEEVEAALWFHDVVYVPGAADNEDRSARLAKTALAAGAVSVEIRRRVAKLVLATRHLTVPRDPDAKLVCDIDLSILGREPAVFDRFERAIRQEYAHIAEPEYRHERAAVLAGFLRRESLYQTGYFRDHFEQQARTNLKRVLRDLTE
jgi:predicted metal-dependent HD superfamily phosphohydrolase